MARKAKSVVPPRQSAKLRPRWKSGTPKGPAGPAREDEVPYRTPGSVNASVHRFIDLFCGIGGFRLGFERAGGRCVFFSDYDKFSQQTYEENFGERPHGDIHTVAVADIPAHEGGKIAELHRKAI